MQLLRLKAGIGEKRMYPPPDEPIQGSDPYSDPYSSTDQNTMQEPLYGPASIPPPPPNFNAEQTIPPPYRQVSPTVKAAPPHAPIVPKKPKQRKALSTRKAIAIYLSMPIVACVLLMITINVINHVEHAWTTTHTYTGSKNDSEQFTVSNTWRISWLCAQTSDTPQTLTVSVYTDNNALLYDSAVYGYCSYTPEGGISNVLLQGGNVILKITTDSSNWTVNIQEQA